VPREGGGALQPLFWRIRLLAASLFFAGCAATAAQRGEHSGYWDAKVDAETYEVGYRCNGATPREDVHTYLLYRSAEITEQAGFDYFEIVEEDSESKPFVIQSPQTVTFAGASSFGPGAVSGRTKHALHATIRLSRGEKPAGAYAAAEVLQSLGPSIGASGLTTRAASQTGQVP